jgi:hypothetical protein
MASCLPATIKRYLDETVAMDMSDPEEQGIDAEEYEAPVSSQSTLPRITQDQQFQMILRSYADLKGVDSKFDEFVAYLRRLEDAELAGEENDR